MSEKKGVHPVSGPNPASQSAAEQTDLNKMSQKYLAQARLGNPMGRKPMFIDVPAQDLQTMMNTVIKAQESFRRVPAKIRNKFANNPVTLIAFLQDPENRREGVEMGLIDDPVLLRQMQMEDAAAKAAKTRVRNGDMFDPQTGFAQDIPLKADPEANPGFPKGGNAPKGA